ncbi:hypothetical protein CORC01_09031 [Colletotrichum orchidophilum]|uniref:Uncharacterized protein n=1 Tax=Colletotrichum orchidophilum TaxID=1209926 RepID=A0A1G4B2E2_9PEZI|nr:uncharacterized protein CORC01_09031 [Colletotrichum orchidophilum]OHE95599.1 hypothetical protein CORC01_09031 [Colletotrichum orchidophilum]
MVDMDDATRLIGDLHQKLADLDHKVAAYRQDMATEFHRYSHQLLQNIPQHTSAEVDRRVAASFDNYPALRPALSQSLTSPLRDLPDSTPPPPSTEDTENLARLHNNPGNPREPPPPSPKSTPPSVLPHAGTATLTSPDSVYDRERDRGFHGLFTPSYLPLLDSSHESPAPAANQSPILSSIPNPAATQDDMGRRKSGQAQEQPAIKLSVAATQTPERPNHERRATDDTTSSGASEQSESKVRRSALRRSSSGIKPPASPRRVRFEFEGGEVLPTASPQSSEPSLVQSHTLANSRSPPPSEDESMSVESLLGPDEDSGPPPKKVSSSQALRALSRAPLDANTVWTVVNAEAQDKENGSMATSDSETSLQTSSSVGPTLKPQSPPKITLVERKRAPEPLRPVSPERDSRRNDDDDDSDGSSSDDGFLAMAKPKSFANKKAILSPLSRSPTRTVTAPYSPIRDESVSHEEDKLVTQSDGAEEDDDEDMFHFEGLSAPPKPRSRPAPIQEEEEEEEEEDEDEDEDEDAPSNEPVTQTLYSTSPAVSIPKPVEPAIPAHLISGSVGSFRGRPVIMPVVKNPDVYQQAASLGDVSSFIGGLDGRSGVDDGDLSSYRASVGQSLFSGTPRSLMERMMMEEAQSQRRAAAQRPQ